MTEHSITLHQLEVEHSNAEHSIFAPSSSASWLHCAGSLIVNLMAEETAGYDAAWGTVFHALTEEWLKTGKKPTYRNGTTEFVERTHDWWGFFIDIDVHMFDCSQTCVDSVEMEPGIHFYEWRVDFSRVTPIPKQRGTADCVILQPKPHFHIQGRMQRQLARLIVVDWKGGIGVQVFAENNTQEMLYALGAFYEFEFDYYIDEIELRIEQPRLNHSDAWVITREKLLEFEAWAKLRAAAAWRLDAPRTAGVKQCRWCKVQAECAVYAKMLIDLTSGAFENLERTPSTQEIVEFKDSVDVGLIRLPVDVYTLTVPQMVALYEFREMVDPWFKAVHELLSKRAEEGLPVPGMKLVEGRSNRLFVNDELAIAKLVLLGIEQERLIKTKVVSPAEAEDLLRAVGHRRKEIPALLEGLIRKPPGKPTLVPVSDKRPALACSTEGVFDSLH